MQELSLSINMMLSKVASVKRVNVLEAITDELDHNFRNQKTGHIRLTSEVICIAGQRSYISLHCRKDLDWDRIFTKPIDIFPFHIDLAAISYLAIVKYRI